MPNREELNFKPFKNKPTHRIVCWVCKSGQNITLFRVTKKEKGKHKQFIPEKNLDYVCIKHLNHGKPQIGNQSRIVI